MISADFAPNESGDDAVASLKLFFQPWIWKKGKALARLKLRLKNYFPDSQIFLFFSARAGLYHLLKSQNFPKDSKVLVQAFTCEAVILPVLANDLLPQYVDTETKSFSMNLKDLEKKYTADSRALILQHTFGMTPIERERILEFAKNKKLFVIEDLAQGFDLNLFKTMKQSSNLAILLSFGRSKMFSSVWGGGVVTTNPKATEMFSGLGKSINLPSYMSIFNILLYKPMAYLVKKTYAIYIGIALHKSLNLLGIFTKEITRRERGGEFDQDLNKAYPNALAKLLLVQINKIERVNNIRSSICTKYSRTFKHNYGNVPLIRYPILVDKRKSLLKAAVQKKIYLGTWHDPVVSPHGIDLEKMKYKKGSCPEAEGVSKKIVNLPTLISDKDADLVLKLFS